MLRVTCHIWQVCCICPSMMYFPELMQIQHTYVYNMEIKVATLFPLILPTQSTNLFL